MNKKKTVLTIEEAQALLSAAYTQVEQLKSDLRIKNGEMAYEIKIELKYLRSAIKKLRVSR